MKTFRTLTQAETEEYLAEAAPAVLREAIANYDSDENRAKFTEHQIANDHYAKAMIEAESSEAMRLWRGHLEFLLPAVANLWYRWSGQYIPKLYRDANFAALAPEQEPDLLRKWVGDREARNLFLVGSHGTGKTFAAYAVLQECAASEVLRRPRSSALPVAWSLASLLDAMRPQADDAEDVWRAAKEAPMLLLDDLAHTRPTDWATERLWMLADYRTAQDLTTIVTTNAAAGDLMAAWGAPTMDRLFDAAAVVKVAGESRRGMAW